MKKTLSLLMAAAMTVGSTVCVYADTNSISDDVAVITPAESAEASVSAMVTVKDVTADTITVVSEDDQTIELKINDETVFMDSELAIPFSYDELKADDKIYVEYSSVMTRSLPPQTNAYLIAKNTEKGGIVNLMKADTVEKDKDGNTVVFDKAQNVMLTVLKDADVKPYRTKNIVKIDDIIPGTEFVAWYDIVTMSIPAYASTGKVRVTKTADLADDVNFGTVTVDEGALKADPSQMKLIVNDKEITLTKPMYFEENTLMVPLRMTAEALGYTVGWDAESGAITVEDAYVQKATLFNNSSEVSFNGKLKIITMDRTVTNEKDTVIHDGTTFVPVSFFAEFMNDVDINSERASVSAQTAELQ